MLTAEKSQTKEGRTAQEEDTSTMQQTSKMVLKKCVTQGDRVKSLALLPPPSHPDQGFCLSPKDTGGPLCRAGAEEESRLGGLRLGGPRLGHGEG